MTVKIEIKGLADMKRKLDSIKATEILEAPMNRAVIRLESRMKEYPPARAGQKYVRTGTLGRNWDHQVDRVAGGLRGTVGNSRTSYGPFVQSSRFQRPYFRGRWQTDQIVLEQERSAIERDFERAIAAAL